MVECGVQHEQRHQELLLADLQHLLSCNPLRPVYAPAPCAAEPAPVLYKWMAQPDGVQRIGYDGSGFCFDHELPRHRIFLEAYEIALRPVTNAEYLEFIADRGYQRPELWLSEGWDVRTAQDWSAPLYWEADGACWQAFTLNGMRALQPDAPVCHVSFFEADAYARWASARLPTEAEWETLAAAWPITGNFLENGRFHPAPPGEQQGSPKTRIYGDVWEWTGSAYLPYPGFKPATGAVGEYNGKFMCSQLVLRGGPCATPEGHIRKTYRNFFYPHQRWQFMGLRLAANA